MKTNGLIYFIKIFAIVILMSLSFTSCSYFAADIPRFGGGELLDKEMISSIKSEIFSGSDTSESETNKSGNESQVIIDVRETEAEEESETSSKAEPTTEDRSEITDEPQSSYDTEEEDTVLDTAGIESIFETSSEATETGDRITVYWSKGGSAWHLSTKCHYIAESDTVYAGYVEDAKAAKKSKLCSYCEKHYQD